jgi:tRNA A-37 threonylcarbamoyl transferase component Bud32
LDFKVKGHSKYKLSLVEGWVKKSASEEDERLVKSAVKQKDFKSEYFKSPMVLDTTSNYFLMEYIEGHSFVEFLTYATKNDIDKLIKKFEGYFSETITGQESISSDVFIEKLNSIDSSLINKFNHIPKEVKIYKGKCHGDLTLSNMIFANDVYMIDFLDSFIESPTIDLVKLRQDTHLGWSLEMSELKYDINKLKISLNYLDEWLVNTYDINEYHFLQKVNLCRILPYAKTDSIKRFIDNKFNTL